MNLSNLRECELWLLTEFSAKIATRDLMNGHITLALGEVTEPDPLAARSAAPASLSSIARLSQDR